ncbi:hypothetical protein KNO81_41600 [Paraburkholderia sediminicola]|nr:hypothetical protein [Paraburkholderia sediminicola]
MSDFDRFIRRVEVGKITLDVHFTFNVIVSRNADQPRVCEEFPKGEIRRRVDNPPMVPAMHDYLRNSG